MPFLRIKLKVGSYSEKFVRGQWDKDCKNTRLASQVFARQTMIGESPQATAIMLQTESKMTNLESSWWSHLSSYLLLLRNPSMNPLRKGENLNPEKVGFPGELSGRFQVTNEQVDHILSFPTDLFNSIGFDSQFKGKSLRDSGFFPYSSTFPFPNFQERIKFPQNINRVADRMDRVPERKFLIELEFDLFIWVVHISST
ncbi:hypothetical protein ACFX13_032749 [Malus domestica]